MKYWWEFIHEKSWKNELRDALRRLEQDKNVAVMLEKRIALLTPRITKDYSSSFKIGSEASYSDPVFKFISNKEKMEKELVDIKLHVDELESVASSLPHCLRELIHLRYFCLYSREDVAEKMKLYSTSEFEKKEIKLLDMIRENLIKLC